MKAFDGFEPCAKAVDATTPIRAPAVIIVATHPSLSRHFVFSTSVPPKSFKQSAFVRPPGFSALLSLSSFQIGSSQITQVDHRQQCLLDYYFTQHPGRLVRRAYVLVGAGYGESVSVALAGLQKAGIKGLGARRIAYLGRINCGGWIAGGVMDRVADILPLNSFADFYRDFRRLISRRHIDHLDNYWGCRRRCTCKAHSYEGRDSHYPCDTYYTKSNQVTRYSSAGNFVFHAPCSFRFAH